MAKRCIVVDLRLNKDEKTNDELLFLTLYRLPTKMKNGGLWHPRSNESVVNVCINKTKEPESFVKMLNVLPGSLVDVTFGINDFTNKTFVAKTELVVVNPIKVEDIYI